MTQVKDGEALQKRVEEFISRHHLGTDISTRYIDLVSEVGELGKEITKSTQYGKEAFSINGQVVDEIGDCLFSLFALCEALNIDAHDALCKSLSKYQHRFENTGAINSERSNYHGNY